MLNGQSPSSIHINVGILQGFILGLILLLVFITTFPMTSIPNSVIYADDLQKNIQ